MLQRSLGFLVLAAGLAWGGTVHADCAADEVLVYEDNDAWYCEDAGVVEALRVEATTALGAAAQNPTCVGAVACNFFAAAVGAERDIPYFRDIKYPRKPGNQAGGVDEYRKANEIYRFIAKAVKSEPSGWLEVTPDQAQRWADVGRFVVGVAANTDSSKPGHIVVAVPADLPPQGGGSNGPWVRDAQNPATSVRSSLRFGSGLKPVIWAVYLGYVEEIDEED